MPVTGTTLFPGFSRQQVQTSGATINLVRGGSGPPVLLLHGFPQTHAMWHQVAPVLAESHTVIAADLRGYGDSSKPNGGGEHAAHSFRAMAADQVEVMRTLGHERFVVLAHDRGARVAHRMALDHPDTVDRLAVLDIVPTAHVLSTVDRRLASSYFHWFFLTQPEPLPEKMIGADPLLFLHACLGAFGSGLDTYAPQALAEYERCFGDPGTIRGVCEDYRAAMSIDAEHDRVDRGRRLSQPLLVLWGSRGIVGQLYDPLAVWSEYSTDVRGQGLDGGHFLVEERSEETIRLLQSFLAER